MIKTIDVNAKEWLDAKNANSYYTAEITVDFGLPTQKNFYLSFRYGYGDQYVYESLVLLQNAGIISTRYTSELRQNGVILRYSKKENCKKSELRK